METRKSQNYRSSLKLSHLSKNYKSMKYLLSQKKIPSNNMSFSFRSHPAAKYIRGTQLTKQQFQKFITILYKSLSFSIYSLEEGNEKRKLVNLPQPKKNKKFLFLDLDETLIHSLEQNQKGEVQLKQKQYTLNFNVRPYCESFLQKMNEHFNVFVFTASGNEYAETIVKYFNRKQKRIHGILSEQHCIKMKNGLYIKDLTIIKNRDLSDIILVDNLVHSFGLQIENGIPILQFRNNKEDKELLGLQKLLISLSDFKDVRKYLRKKLELRNVLQAYEDDFISVSYRNQQKEKNLKV